MTLWAHALGIPLCQREASSHCLVAEDALHGIDIPNGPQGASPWLWLTELHGELCCPIIHQTLCSLCGLVITFSVVAQDAQSCVTLCLYAIFHKCSCKYIWGRDHNVLAYNSLTFFFFFCHVFALVHFDCTKTTPLITIVTDVQHCFFNFLY